MASSQEDRDRLKEEYKDHYRQILDAKKKFQQMQPKKRIVDALNKMKTSDLMQDMDDMMGKVRYKAYEYEAKVEQSLDDYFADEVQKEKVRQNEEELAKENARRTVNALKAEMGDLYSETVAKAKDIAGKKTIGKPIKMKKDTTDQDPKQNDSNDQS